MILSKQKGGNHATIDGQRVAGLGTFTAEETTEEATGSSSATDRPPDSRGDLVCGHEWRTVERRAGSVRVWDDLLASTQALATRGYLATDLG